MCGAPSPRKIGSAHALYPVPCVPEKAGHRTAANTSETEAAAHRGSGSLERGWQGNVLEHRDEAVCTRDLTTSCASCHRTEAAVSVRQRRKAGPLAAPDLLVAECAQRVSRRQRALSGQENERDRRRRGRISSSAKTAAMLLMVILSLIRNHWSGPGWAQGLRMKPSWQWGGQTLYACAESQEDRETVCKCYTKEGGVCETSKPKEADAQVAAGRRRSCTSDPKTQFPCTDPNSETDKGCKCESKCVTFDTGWDSSTAKRNGPACMESIFSLEDTWSRLNFYFLDESTGALRTPQNIKDAGDTSFQCAGQSNADGTVKEHLLKVELRVRHGSFNLYDMQQRCPQWINAPLCTNTLCTTAPPLLEAYNVRQCRWTRKADIFSPSTPCTVDRVVDGVTYACDPQNPDDSLESLLFWTDNPRFVGMEFVGTYQAVYAAMKNLYYKAKSNQNTRSLRSRIYNPEGSRDQPFEEMFSVVSVNEACMNNDNFLVLGNFTQLLHIVDMNDPPTVTDPSSQFILPFDCVAASTEDKCHFGQFYADEDSSGAVQISGIQIDDIDVKEKCPYDSPECSEIDVNVRAAHGTVALNTRSRLNFYENVREARGFTSFLTPANSAVKVVFYRVENVENLGPTSKVLNFNTQNSGNKETIKVIVSDQGLTGAAEQAKKVQIIIDVTIIAINDAPVITLEAVEYSVVEDVPFILTGLSVEDQDIDEEIDSSLARLTWMNDVANQQNLNQMQFSVKVIHGILKLNIASRLRLVDTAEYSFFTIEAFRFGHDTCRLKGIYDDSTKLIAAATATEGVAAGNPGRYSQGICAYVNIGQPDCPTGKETLCSCRLIDSTCREDGTITLYVNNTALPFSNYYLLNGTALPFSDSPSDNLGRRVEDPVSRLRWFEILGEAISQQDKTCGGMPWYPAPNDFSYGLPCQTDADCTANVFEACTLGVNCTCCANASHVCSTDNDCSKFDKGSSCGCMLGGPASGQCGPYCTNAELTTGCTTEYLNLYKNSPDAPKFYGRRCTFRAPFSISKVQGATNPSIRECLPGAYGVEGSDAKRIVDLVTTESVGSKRITFMGHLADVQNALKAVSYVTDVNYNRLYRPPVEERDEKTFDITVDHLDILDLKADDRGNSGGKSRDVKIVSHQAKIRVSAVNDRPKANGPFQVLVKEDIPFHFSAATDTALYVSDPDYEDYGFKQRVFTVNLTCTNGRLYLNEEFLQTPGVANNRISFRFWGSGQEKRGLHYETKLDAEPKYGEKCQMKPQCSDGSDLKSEDKPWGFSRTEQHGVVYSPVTRGGAVEGCGVCPADTGNKFISIQGVFDDINQALSFVTYLPDPHFNTRSLDMTKKPPAPNAETIDFQVDDNGGIGNDQTAPSLRHRLQIWVEVESVNDRPIIGRRLERTRMKDPYDGGLTLPLKVLDTAILDMNKTLDAFCASLPPAGAQYTSICAPASLDPEGPLHLGRQFIDIDEDGEFYITSDILWIEDVDSDEAAEMESPRRFCCDPQGLAGCKCGSPCECNNAPCGCKIPDVCDETQVTPSQLKVHFSVEHGVLQFYPPPGRDFFPESDLRFLTNDTLTAMHEGGTTVRCEDQKRCMVNTSQINMEGKKEFIQKGLKWMFLTYKPKPNYYGPDQLKVWVSDMGYTDECYNASLTASETINIRVVGVNDPPVVFKPKDVSVYPRGSRCFNSFHDHPSLNSILGLNPECENNQNNSMIPPADTGAPVQFSDVDIDDKEYGNLTVRIQIGTDEIEHKNAGSFTLVETNEFSRNWLELYRDSRTGLITLNMLAKIDEMNKLMNKLRYDADPIYLGYVPIRVYANDNKNFGECSGEHKCGKEEVCGDHHNAEPHLPVTPGMSDVILDASIGAQDNCQASDCKSCVQLDGCGWCPSSCWKGSFKSSGKCMTGTQSGPLFDKCQPVNDKSDPRKWNQCERETRNDLVLWVSLGGGGFVFCTVIYIFWRWTSRRHGSMTKYLQKKKADFKRAGRKAHLLPPDAANYNMFFTLIVFTIASTIGFFLTDSSRPECIFNEAIFLGKTSFLHLESDGCKVRFVSTRNMSAPDNLLDALKVQVAVPVGKSIMVNRDTCSPGAKISIINKKEEAERFVKYYCNVQILVPDRFVIPKTTITAMGNNVTYVRAGSMDPDSNKFGLRFGPNSFMLKGNNMVARLQNLTASHFEFDVLRGILMGIQVMANTARLNSQDADMIMTTGKQTSVKFWQKADNRVCLTAAQNSLYVDDSCNRICKLKSAGRRAREHLSSFDTLNSSGTDFRQSVLPWLCTTLPSGKKDCKKYDPVQAELDDLCPVGAPFKKKSQVPQTVGCYRLSDCTIDESPQCLCKPKCDMAGLNPPGQCNSLGQCCQTICQGYSKADMFPEKDQPRCISTSTTWWCNGTLDQRWNFTSVNGQISLEVVKDTSIEKHNSYQGSVPAPTVDVNLDIRESDKVVLDQLFHPGGANNPDQPWFALRLQGPGAPEASDGQFVWLKSIRSLILPNWLVNLLSMGLLAPSKGATLSGLNPAFCPAFTPSNSALFSDRVRQLRAVLLRTIQTYPGPESREIPFTSLLAYLPVGGVPSVFSLDASTNQIMESKLRTNSYILIIFTAGMAVSLASMVASALLLRAAISGFKAVAKFRQQKLREELLTANLNQVFTKMAMVDDEELANKADKILELKARTNFFYCFDEFVFANAEEQRSVLTEWFVVVCHNSLVLVPALIIWFQITLVKTSYQEEKCEFRPDVCICFSEVDLLLTIYNGFVISLIIYYFTCVLEMSGSYLRLSYGIARKLIRMIFYILYFVINLVALELVFTLMLFVLIGIIINPTKLAPYGLAIIGTGACCVSYFAKRWKFMIRVERAVAKRMDVERGRLKQVPPVLVDVLINKNVTKSLAEQGLTISRIIVSTFIFWCFQVMIYIFLILGFTAFTNPNSIESGFVNSAITITVSLGLHAAVAKESEEEVLKDAVEKVQEAVMSRLQTVISMVQQQLFLAMKLYQKMQGKVQGGDLGESLSSGSDDESSNTEDVKK